MTSESSDGWQISWSLKCDELADAAMRLGIYKSGVNNNNDLSTRSQTDKKNIKKSILLKDKFKMCSSLLIEVAVPCALR